MKANEYARHHGKTPFVVYQAAYSVLQRDIERDILPMCRHEGIALTLWNVLAGGHIRTDAEEERRRQTGEKGRTVMGPWERNENEKKVCAALEEVAKQVNAKSITSGTPGFSWPLGSGSRILQSRLPIPCTRRRTSSLS